MSDSSDDPKDVQGSLSQRVDNISISLSRLNLLMVGIIVVLFAAFLGVLIPTMWSYMSSVAQQEAASIEFQKEVRTLNQKLNEATRPSPSTIPTPRFTPVPTKRP